MAVGAAATGVGGAVTAGARMAPAAAKLAGGWCAGRHVGGWQREVGVPGRFRRCGRRRQGRDGGPGQCRQDRRAGGWTTRSVPCIHARRAAHGGCAFRLAGWRRRTGAPASGQAAPGEPPLTAPARRSRNNPPGPSACIAANNSPMPRPPPPTRCAAATAAARAKARACAIPILTIQGELPCDSNDRRCAMPTRRSLPPRTKPPPRCGTSASARPACRRRTGG